MDIQLTEHKNELFQIISKIPGITGVYVLENDNSQAKLQKIEEAYNAIIIENEKGSNINIDLILQVDKFANLKLMYRTLFDNMSKFFKDNFQFSLIKLHLKINNLKLDVEEKNEYKNK